MNDIKWTWTLNPLPLFQATRKDQLTYHQINGSTKSHLGSQQFKVHGIKTRATKQNPSNQGPNKQENIMEINLPLVWNKALAGKCDL